MIGIERLQRSGSARARRAGFQGARRAGFTVVEVILVTVILTVGVLGTIGAVVAGDRLTSVNRQQALAHQAARAMCERMNDTPFRQIFATYNADASDDPAGASLAQGSKFKITDLNLQYAMAKGGTAGSGVLTPVPGATNGSIGTIVFPTRTVAGGHYTLDETVVDKRWGMPRDLDGDGLANRTNITDTYMVLPVRIQMRWLSGGRVRKLDFDYLLAQ